MSSEASERQYEYKGLDLSDNIRGLAAKANEHAAEGWRVAWVRRGPNYNYEVLLEREVLEGKP